jgi:hypothetical protein
MGDNVFSSREQLLQNEALNAYMNSFNQKQQEGLEGKEKAEAYNKILEGITEPIGGLMVGKPVEKVVSMAGRKLLMKAGGEKWLKKQFVKRLAKASNGDLSSFGKDLPSNVEGSIKDVLQDNVPDRINQAFGRLSKKAQNTINDAREAMGKSRLGDRTESEPVNAETETSAINDPAPSEPVAQTEGQLDSSQVAGEPLDTTPSAGAVEEDLPIKQIANDRGQWEDWVEDNIPELDNAGEDTVELVRNHILSNPFISDDLPQSFVKTAFQGGQGGANQQVLAEQAQVDDATAQAQTQPDNPNTDGSDQNSGSSEQPSPDDNGDSNDALGENQDNTDLPNPDNASTEATDVSGTTDDVLDGLEGASDALDVAAASEGGLNIFADIIAGVAGLATLIGGAVGGKKAPPTQTDYLTSGVQYGV